MTPPIPYSSERTCYVCGKFGAFEFNGETLCGDCTHDRGSCCTDLKEGQDDSPLMATNPNGSGNLD